MSLRYFTFSDKCCIALLGTVVGLTLSLVIHLDRMVEDDTQPMVRSAAFAKTDGMACPVYLRELNTVRMAPCKLRHEEGDRLALAQ